MRARGVVRLGVGSQPSVRLRPEVGDEGRGPPVGESGQAAAGESGLSWAGMRGRAAELGWKLQAEVGCCARGWAGLRSGEGEVRRPAGVV
jgi:hypothetical protein